jgi:hypothetical protein
MQATSINPTNDDSKQSIEEFILVLVAHMRIQWVNIFY